MFLLGHSRAHATQSSPSQSPSTFGSHLASRRLSSRDFFGFFFDFFWVVINDPFSTRAISTARSRSCNFLNFFFGAEYWVWGKGVQIYADSHLCVFMVLSPPLKAKARVGGDPLMCALVCVFAILWCYVLCCAVLKRQGENVTEREKKGRLLIPLYMSTVCV